MANRHRGEIEAEIGGVRRRLVLTLGALAELEDAFGADDYGVNSGTGRSGKVLRRMLGLRNDSSTVTDAVIAAARAADPKILIAGICDERLRFLQALKTWPVFGAGWGRRVAEVKSTALKMAADAAKASTMARNK